MSQLQIKKIMTTKLPIIFVPPDGGTSSDTTNTRKSYVIPIQRRVTPRKQFEKKRNAPLSERKRIPLSDRKRIALSDKKHNVKSDKRHLTRDNDDDTPMEEKQLLILCETLHQQQTQNVAFSNRACDAKPSKEDFGQDVHFKTSPICQDDFGQTSCTTPLGKLLKTIEELYNINPELLSPDALKRLVANENVDPEKVDISAQCSKEPCYYSSHLEPPLWPVWETIDNANDIDQILQDDVSGKLSAIPPEIPEEIEISKVPKTKTVATKLYRYKRRNVEVRKCVEKIICMEYDVYNKDSRALLQKMRAYFSVRPTVNGESDANNFISATSVLPDECVIFDKKLSKLNEKEIEIIDAAIPENRAYLDDLKKILLKKQAASINRRRSSKNLMCLYEMAKLEEPLKDYEFSKTNLFRKDEMNAFKDLLLKRSDTITSGITRKRIKSDSPRDITGSFGSMNERRTIIELIVQST